MTIGQREFVLNLKITSSFEDWNTERIQCRRIQSRLQDDIVNDTFYQSLAHRRVGLPSAAAHSSRYWKIIDVDEE